jgi:hypothetical protein
VALATGFLILDLEVVTAMIFLAPFLLQSLADRLIKKPQFTSIPLHEGAEARYGFAENQVLYLEGAFIRVERFRIGKEAANVVIGGDAITAQKLPRPSDRLAALGSGERFGK